MAQTAQPEAMVVEKGDGTTVVLHHVKEWQKTAPESLREIEAIIDSWGGATSTRAVPDHSNLDAAELEARVDKITRKVKGSRKVEVTETVTEWVEGPPGSGPIAVEADPPQATEPWVGQQEPAAPRSERPKRRFSLFSRKAMAADAPKPTADKDYQPQCVALTADGAQCRNSSRDGSRYCISHFGYQPPTVKGLAQRIEGDAWSPDDGLTNRDSVSAVDTRPAVKRAPDTRLRSRKPAKRGKPGKASKKKR
jgi:hypothetical protein